MLKSLASIITLRKLELERNQIDKKGAEILYKYKSPLLTISLGANVDAKIKFG